MKEPSVLDYVKAKLTPWRGPAPKIPPAEPTLESKTKQARESAQEIIQPVASAPQMETGEPVLTIAPSEALQTAQTYSPQAIPVPVQLETQPEAQIAYQAAAPVAQVIAWPWRSLVALFLALVAQMALSPRPDRSWLLGAILYALAFGWIIVANWRKEWTLAELPQIENRADSRRVRIIALEIGLPVALAAFWFLSGNRFTKMNVFLWLGSLALIMYAFWVKEDQGQSWLSRLREFLRRPKWQIGVSRWTILVLIAAALVIFFRVYQLNQVPAEMVSDQAEKLWDVRDLLNGATKIFFERNTGREFIQFYLTAAIIQLLHTGISFISLKIGTVLIGLLTLPFIYLLGKEMGSSRAGLLAAFLGGIAYWPNVFSRAGLRFPLYPFFVAPTLYFLIRGMRRSNRNDFILAGLFLGFGLHGYTPFRFMPVVVVAAVGLYLIHRQSKGVRLQTLGYLALTALMALVVFLPLLRYATENPQMFEYRAFTRLGTTERPLPGPAGQIFLSNLWNAVSMYAWDDGEIWPISVTHRPALDVVSAVLLYLGAALLLVRYARKRHWLDIFLVLSVPLLMMPSILSLAFPAENPALNRAAGAMVPVFLIIGLAFDGLLTSIETGLASTWGKRFAWGLGLVLIFWSTVQNYDLVFRQYKQSYDSGAWNTSEMGAVIRNFADSSGSLQSSWVVAYPYWVDTRLVGINAGDPNRDYAISVDQLQDTQSDPRPKLFLVNLQDAAALEKLKSLYPRGWVQEYRSKDPNKDFLMFFTPPQTAQP